MELRKSSKQISLLKSGLKEIEWRYSMVWYPWYSNSPQMTRELRLISSKTSSSPECPTINSSLSRFIRAGRIRKILSIQWDQIPCKTLIRNQTSTHPTISVSFLEFSIHSSEVSKFQINFLIMICRILMWSRVPVEEVPISQLWFRRKVLVEDFKLKFRSWMEFLHKIDQIRENWEIIREPLSADKFFHATHLIGATQTM